MNKNKNDDIVENKRTYTKHIKSSASNRVYSEIFPSGKCPFYVHSNVSLMCYSETFGVFRNCPPKTYIIIYYLDLVAHFNN